MDGSCVPVLDVTDEKASSSVARALGDELRRTREARGVVTGNITN